MYDWLPEVCKEIRGTTEAMYWLLLVPLTLFLITLEYFRLPDQMPRIPMIIKRACISVLLMVTFDEAIHLISFVGDGIASHIGGLSDYKLMLKELGNGLDKMEPSLTKIKQTLIFFLSLVSYIAAYAGVFIADAVIQFCWGLLYIVSPLMILAYIPENTQGTCKNLYKQLCMVMTWKILWAILGVMLLKLSTVGVVDHSSGINSQDAYNSCILILINLFIGVSMLFVPFAAKSLVNDGLSGFAATLGAMPTLIAKGAILKGMSKFAQGSKNLGQNIAKGGMEKYKNFRGRNLNWNSSRNLETQLDKYVDEKAVQSPDGKVSFKPRDLKWKNRENVNHEKVVSRPQSPGELKENLRKYAKDLKRVNRGQEFNLNNEPKEKNFD